MPSKSRSSWQLSATTLFGVRRNSLRIAGRRVEGLGGHSWLVVVGSLYERRRITVWTRGLVLGFGRFSWVFVVVLVVVVVIVVIPVGSWPSSSSSAVIVIPAVVVVVGRRDGTYVRRRPPVILVTVVVLALFPARFVLALVLDDGHCVRVGCVGRRPHRVRRLSVGGRCCCPGRPRRGVAPGCCVAVVACSVGWVSPVLLVERSSLCPTWWRSSPSSP